MNLFPLSAFSFVFGAICAAISHSRLFIPSGSSYEGGGEDEGHSWLEM
jgi:hypothetical protein